MLLSRFPPYHAVVPSSLKLEVSQLVCHLVAGQNSRTTSRTGDDRGVIRAKKIQFLTNLYELILGRVRVRLDPLTIN